MPAEVTPDGTLPLGTDGKPVFRRLIGAPDMHEESGYLMEYGAPPNSKLLKLISGPRGESIMTEGNVVQEVRGTKLKLDYNTNIVQDAGDFDIRLSDVALGANISQESYRIIYDLIRVDNLSPWNLNYDEYMKIMVPDDSNPPVMLEMYHRIVGKMRKEGNRQIGFFRN